MSKDIRKTICPRDCYSNCGLLVKLEDGRAVGLQGDPAHPYSKGAACPKSSRFLDLVYSDNRVVRPLVKKDGVFAEITWEDALNLLQDKLRLAKGMYGAESILHYSDYAHSGALHNNVDQRFFRAFGGRTLPRGSLCLSGGKAALTEALGGLEVSDPSQLVKAGVIILWGSNPAVTNVPFVSYLQRARKSGAKVYLIDPIRTETAKFADVTLQPNPGSDVEIVLGLVKALLRHGAINNEFIHRHTQGFAEFRLLVEETTELMIEQNTGLSQADLGQLAKDVAARGPISIIAGWGLQRQMMGPQIIRALANLAAVTGSLGSPGGGIHYAHDNWQMLGDITGQDEFSYTERFFERGAFGSFLHDAAEPELQVAVIARANPVVQNPAAATVARGLAKIPFKVVLDLFLTPTAQMADLVLPVTSFLEDGDLFFNSWHHYLTLSEPVISPVGECRSDTDIFLELADRMGLFSETKEDLLGRVLAPLADMGLSLDQLKQGPWRFPAPLTAWSGQEFATDTGLFKFWSGRETGYKYQVRDSSAKSAGFQYTLLSPQPKERTHSQGFTETGQAKLMFLINPLTAAREGIKDGDAVFVRSPIASVHGIVRVDDAVHPRVVLSYHGVWASNPAAGLNALIPERITYVGEQAAIFDCPCSISREVE